MKRFFLLLMFAFALNMYGQTSDYSKTFEWLVETFSKNDAGFEYIVEKKGENDYSRFTEGIRAKVDDAKTDREFIKLAKEWLHYFRNGHIDFGLRENDTYDRDDISDYDKLKKSSFRDRKLHLDKLSKKTLYLKIPSFEFKHKEAIDSIIKANMDLISVTPNLIIDIRNGTGGSDASFQSLIPLLYTNPIRSTSILLKGSEQNAQGFEYYAKMTNNSQMNDIAKSLRENAGKFVPRSKDDKTSVIQHKKVLPYPQRIAIMIDGGNASSDEQFLILAKQSWKVKLFGRTTYGAIDISNMTVAFSPDDKFYLAYAMSKSKRIPHYTIDDIGLQPDFFIDDEIPETEWINYTKSILEE